MNEAYFMDAGEAFLAHYGVKGMHWGSRRSSKKSNPKRDARLQKRVNRKIHKGRHVVYKVHDNGLQTLGYDYDTKTRTDRRMEKRTSRKVIAYNKELKRLKAVQRKSYKTLVREAGLQ